MNIYKSDSTCPWATQFPKRLSKRDAKRVFDCLVECHNIALNFPAISLETALAGRALSAEPFFKFALPIVFTSLDRKIFRDILGTAFMAGNFSWAKDPVAGIFAMEADTLLFSLGNPALFDDLAFRSFTTTYAAPLQNSDIFRSTFGKMYEEHIPRMEAQPKNYELKIPFAVSKTPVERKQRKQEIPLTTVKDSRLLTDAGSAFDSARFGKNEIELAASAYRYRLILKNHIAKSALHTGVIHDI